jgi:hypothetical protein
VEPLTASPSEAWPTYEQGNSDYEQRRQDVVADKSKPWTRVVKDHAEEHIEDQNDADGCEEKLQRKAPALEVDDSPSDVHRNAQREDQDNRERDDVGHGQGIVP